MYFGEFGEDPFLGNIEGHENIAAIQRNADETTPIFARICILTGVFDVLPAGTCLFGIKIPEVAIHCLLTGVYENLPDDLRDQADRLLQSIQLKKATRPMENLV